MANIQMKNIKPTTFIIDNGFSKKKNLESVPFEDALDMTGFGRYNVWLFGIATIILMSMALVVFGTSYVLLASQCDLHLTLETKGLVAGMPMLGIVASSHLWGWVADTRGRRFVLFISLAGSFVFATLSSLATSWQMLATTNFLCAFFAAASNAVVFALFGECTPSSQRNKLVLYLSGALISAQAFIALNAFIILSLNFSWQITPGFSYRPWRLLEQVYGIWTGFGALMLLTVKESPKFLAAHGREADSVKVLSEIFAMNTGLTVDDYPVKSLKFEESHQTSKGGVLRSMWDQTTPLLRRPLLYKTLVITYIVVDIYAVCPSLLMWTPGIVNAYAHAIDRGEVNSSFCQLFKQHKLAATSNLTATGADDVNAPCVDKPDHLSYIALASFAIILLILNSLNSYLVKYISKRTILIAYHIFSGCCGIMLPLIFNIHGGVALFFLFQINLVSMSLTTGFTVEVYPTYLRAMAVCLTMMVGRGCSILVISMVGVMLESYCELSFYVLGAYVLSGAVVAIFLPGEQRRKETEIVKTNNP